MTDEKLTPSILYTTEAEESKKKTDQEINAPDPEISLARDIIEENTKEEELEDTPRND